jgi:serpin B
MRTTSYFFAALAVTLTAAAGCNTISTDPSPDPSECSDPDQAGCVVASDKQRIQSPDVSPADLETLVSGNSTFAFDLHQQLRGAPGNLFYSPYSISSALAMTWAGARNQTEADMAAALGFKLTQAKLHPAFNALDLALASRGQGAQGSDGKGFRLNVANALWGQMGYPFEAPFLDTLALNYGAGMHIVDFEGATTQAIDLVNAWVDTKTEGKIKKLVSEANVDASTRLILTNAIYFNAAWATPFETANTANGDFKKLDGSTVTVPMMHGYQDTGYAAGDGYEALLLPYDGYELSMVLVLPAQGTFADFEASLDAKQLDAIVSSFSEHGVDIHMPKFKFESEFSLTKQLEALGMGIAFTDAADFSGISSTGKLVISDVVHKSFVSVNEAGTEAAAATAVIAGETSAPEPAAIDLNRPFLFGIRDNATGSLLFFGRVVDPS